MAVSSSVRSAILARGYTPEHLAQWEQDHPGDEGRALSAFSPQASGSSSSGSSSSGASGGSTSRPSTASGASSPAPTGGGGVTNPALAGLQAVGLGSGSGSGAGGGGGAAIPATGEPAAGAGGGMATMLQAMGGGVAPTNLFLPGAPGALRQGMGQRLYPMDVPAMQGLARAY